MIQDPMPVIPEEEYRDRWEAVQELMDQQGLDLILAYADDRATFGPAHARWLANFPVHFEPVCIVMPKRHDPVLLCGPESDHYALLSVPWADVENDLSCLRAVKSPAEIKVIQFAYTIAELGSKPQ
jgi:Xaa-Pro aminopeptidase